MLNTKQVFSIKTILLNTCLVFSIKIPSRYSAEWF